MWRKIKNWYHLFVAVLACIRYGFPARRLIVVGVTGTDGKTTTVNLIYHILNTAGKSVSVVSTIGANINGEASPLGFHVTNPDSMSLQKFLRLAVTGVRGTENYMILEVTSHGLDQYRVWGIPFRVAALTNVTSEHLDYHKTYENYVKTKVRLLQMAGIAVVNKEDGSYRLVNRFLKKDTRFIRTYALKDKGADVTPKNFVFKTDLIGDFNRYNILAAVGVTRELGLPDELIRRGVESFVLPIGRGEVVYTDGFTVMVDFAHTPNSFEQILSSLRPKVKGRIIHVFGSAGERDIYKRPQMGKISSTYADIIILTSEDPRSEGYEKIASEIEEGINKTEFSFFRGNHVNRFTFHIQRGKKYLFETADRQDAIGFAIAMAKEGDYVLLTGKSHEKSMNNGEGEEPWDEFEAVKRALSSRDSKVTVA